MMANREASTRIHELTKDWSEEGLARLAAVIRARTAAALQVSQRR